MPAWFPVERPEAGWVEGCGLWLTASGGLPSGRMLARSREGFLYLVKASMPDPRFTASVLTGLPPRSVALSHLLADIRHLLLDVAWSRME